MGDTVKAKKQKKNWFKGLKAELLLRRPKRKKRNAGADAIAQACPAPTPRSERQQK